MLHDCWREVGPLYFIRADTSQKLHLFNNVLWLNKLRCSCDRIQGFCLQCVALSSYDSVQIVRHFLKILTRGFKVVDCKFWKYTEIKPEYLSYFYFWTVRFVHCFPKRRIVLNIRHRWCHRRTDRQARKSPYACSLPAKFASHSVPNITWRTAIRAVSGTGMRDVGIRCSRTSAGTRNLFALGGSRYTKRILEARSTSLLCVRDGVLLTALGFEPSLTTDSWVP